MTKKNFIALADVIEEDSLAEAIYTLQSLRHDAVNTDNVLDESGNVVLDAYAVLKHAEEYLRTYQRDIDTHCANDPSNGGQF